MLYVQIPKDVHKLKTDISALEWQLSQDIPEKDRQIFQETLAIYRNALSGNIETGVKKI